MDAVGKNVDLFLGQNRISKENILRKLPYDAEVEYLESTGTQWIDTGITFTDFDTATMGFVVTKSISTNRCVIGAYADDSTAPRFQIFVSNTQYVGYLSGVDTITGLTYNQRITTGTKYDISFTTTSQADTSVNVFVFARNNDRGNFLQFNGLRVYSLFMQKDSLSVRDFIPVRVGSVGYLYDRVSGQLFGNAGTGAFLVGPDTFSQGVARTRMMAVGVREKEVLGSVAFSGEMDSNLEWYDSYSSGPGDFTFSAWVRAAASPTRGAFAKIGNRQVGTTPGAGIGLGFGSSRFDPSYSGQNFVGLAESVAWANSPSNASTINSWHHYVATLSGYTLSVYIDGSLFWTNTFSSVKSMSPFRIYLGGNRGGNSGGDTNRFLACNMTRCAFWNRALSAMEVAQDYADGKNAPTVTSGLQHFWPMSHAKNYLKDEVGAATLTAGPAGVTISTDTPFI